MIRHAAGGYGNRMCRHSMGRPVCRGSNSIPHLEAPPGKPTCGVARVRPQGGPRSAAGPSFRRDGARTSGCIGWSRLPNTGGQPFCEAPESATFRRCAVRTNASVVPFHGHVRADQTIGRGTVRLFSPPFARPYTAVMAARRARGVTNEPVTTAAAGITQPARHPSPRREVGPAEVIVETVPDPGAAATIARWGEHLARLGRSAGTRRGVDRLQTQPTPRPAAHGRDGGRNA